MNNYIAILFLVSFCSLSSTTKTIQTCELKGGDLIKLVTHQTVDGDTPYFTFRQVIRSALLDDKNIYSGGIILSKCVNHTLIFNFNYGSPYLKGCLVTGVIKKPQAKDSLEGFCFSERNNPDSIWFGKMIY